MPTCLWSLPGSSLLSTLFSTFSWPLTLLVLALSTGCGQLKSYQATEQLLLSNAVDEAVVKLDFTPLSGKKVFVDTTFVRDGKTYGCLHDGYLISSVRQQMMSDGCLLFDKREEAEVIVEARVGTLGADAHEITYGLPASNALSSAATAMGTGAPIPAIPEISLAKRTQNDGAAKLALFAFDAKSREPLWQSGVTLAKTTSANTWLLGAGPWPKRQGWKLFGGGDKDKTPAKTKKQEEADRFDAETRVTLQESHVFPALRKSKIGQPMELIAKAAESPEKKEGATAKITDTGSEPAPLDHSVKQASGETPVAAEKGAEPPANKALVSSGAVGQ